MYRFLSLLRFTIGGRSIPHMTNVELCIALLNAHVPQLGTAASHTLTFVGALANEVIPCIATASDGVLVELTHDVVVLSDTTLEV